METITFEICVAEGDPFDRTLGVLIRSQHELVACQSFRIEPGVRMGEVLTQVDRIVLAWALPALDDQSHIWDTFDAVEKALTAPF